MLLALALLACGDPSDASPCREGFAPAPDGHCYPELEVDGEDPTFADAFRSLPPCTPGSTDGTLDIATGCASGVCIGGTIDESIEALSLHPTCYASGQTQLVCRWIRGIEILIADQSRSGWPDPDATASRVRVYHNYAGGTHDGLGVPVPVRCFTEVLGMPDRAVLQDVGGRLYPREMAWHRYGLTAYDLGSMGGGYPSGIIDNLYLYGAD